MPVVWLLWAGRTGRRGDLRPALYPPPGQEDFIPELNDETGHEVSAAALVAPPVPIQQVRDA